MSIYNTVQNIKSANSLQNVVNRMRATPLFGGGSVSGIGMSGQVGVVGNVNLSNAIEQYQHNVGWVNASIRAIANSVSGQTIHVGVVKSKKNFDGINKKVFDNDSDQPKETKNKKLFSLSGVYNRERATEQIWMKKSLPGRMKSYYNQAELIDNHPILEAIRSPNPMMSGSSLLYVTIFSMELTGKGFWWIEVKKDGDLSGNGTPINIWYLPSHWVEPMHLGGKLFSHWKITPDGIGRQFVVPKEQIVYFPLPNPSDPFGTYATLQAQATTVITDEAIATAQMQSFTRGIFPGYAITVGNIESPDGEPTDQRMLLDTNQRNKLINAIKKMYQGYYNFDEPVILDRLIQKMEKLTLTPNEMGFQASGAYTKSSITQGFGVNPIVMGQVESANRASAAAAKANLYDVSVNPRISLISEVLTSWFNSLNDGSTNDKILIFIEECIANDPDTDQRIVDLLTKIGATTRNEARATFNMPPLVNGDNFMFDSKFKMSEVDIASKEFNMIVPSPKPESASDQVPKQDSLDTQKPLILSDGVIASHHVKSKAAGFPDVRQQNDSDCGIAAVLAVCQYWGYDVSYASAKTGLQFNENDGVKPESVVAYFMKNTFEISYKPNASINDLKKSLDKGWPALCPIQLDVGNGKKIGHWVSVIEIPEDLSKVIYMCPSKGKTSINADMWLTNWLDYTNEDQYYRRYMISIGPPNQSWKEQTTEISS